MVGLLHNHGASLTQLNDESISKTEYKELPKSATNFSLASTAKSRRENREQYYHNLDLSYKRKVKAVVISGILLFLAGIVCTVWHFLDAKSNKTISKNKGKLKLSPPDALTLSGPVLLSIGLLVFVCGVTWVPIYKDKIKHIIKSDEYA